MKIAIIGAGNMGGSIARGLAKGSLIARFGYHCIQSQCRKTRETEKRISGYLHHSTITQKLPQEQTLSSLAVKPWFMEPVMRELKLKSKQILISVAAGISFEELAHYVDSTGNAHVPPDSEHRYQRTGKHDACCRTQYER